MGEELGSACMADRRPPSSERGRERSSAGLEAGDGMARARCLAEVRPGCGSQDKDGAARTAAECACMCLAVSSVLCRLCTYRGCRRRKDEVPSGGICGIERGEGAGGLAGWLGERVC